LVKERCVFYWSKLEWFVVKGEALLIYNLTALAIVAASFFVRAYAQKRYSK